MWVLNIINVNINYQNKRQNIWKIIYEIIMRKKIKQTYDIMIVIIYLPDAKEKIK